MASFHHHYHHLHKLQSVILLPFPLHIGCIEDDHLCRYWQKVKSCEGPQKFGVRVKKSFEHISGVIFDVHRKTFTCHFIFLWKYLVGKIFSNLIHRGVWVPVFYIFYSINVQLVRKLSVSSFKYIVFPYQIIKGQSVP